MDMTLLTPSSVLSLRADLLVETVDDESLVLDLNRNVYFGLNPMALEIWNDLKEGATMQEIVASLVTRYNQDEMSIFKDVQEFLHMLIEHGLATVQEEVTRS